MRLSRVMEIDDHPPAPPPPRIEKSEYAWRRALTPEQYRILRLGGTERPFGAAYARFLAQGAGLYTCGGCGAMLFSSAQKLDSHYGWPSFFDTVNHRNLVMREDYTHGLRRTEILCAHCGGHLGHVFHGEGFETPTDMRYCVNSGALTFLAARGD